MFKNDGSSHENGTKGEESILLFLNDEKNFDFVKKSIKKVLDKEIKFNFEFQKKGGTTNRQDLYDSKNDISISVKSKKIDKNQKYKGTFDLLNTSSIEELVDKKDTNFYNSLFEYVNSLNFYKEKKEISRNEFEKVIKEKIKKMVNNINFEIINNIFKKIIDLDKNIITVIRDYSRDINEDITKNDLHFLSDDWIFKEIQNISKKQENKTDKQSFRLLNKDNEYSVFRIRIALNNGINSLMEQLKMIKTQNKNKNSKLTFKIQVDGVKNVVEKYDVNLNEDKKLI